jgi:ankyrin repeat protein
MVRNQYLLAVAIAATVAATPAAAQVLNDADRFVKAARERDAATAMEVLNSRGLAIIDARDAKGDTALVLAMARRDEDWAGYLLSQGANPNAAARNGDTPLIAAARVGFSTGATQLVARRAKVDLANRMGETALIVAVQQRQLPIIRLLLAAGADPDKTDNAAGYSARDYAKRDTRSREILKLIEAAKPAARP